MSSRAQTSSAASAPASDVLQPTRTTADLATRYARLIRSAVNRVGGAAASRIGEDVEQRVLIQLHRRLENEQVIHHPASYLYRAAVRETVRVLQGEERVERDREAAASVPPGVPPGPERELASSELRSQIAETLATLVPTRRRAVRAHLAGFSAREIMGMYGWNYNRVRNLIARGMADLRRELRERGIDG